MFENTAVIRVHLGDRCAFDQLPTRVREAGLAAFGRACPRSRTDVWTAYNEWADEDTEAA